MSGLGNYLIKYVFSAWTRELSFGTSFQLGNFLPNLGDSIIPVNNILDCIGFGCFQFCNPVLSAVNIG